MSKNIFIAISCLFFVLVFSGCSIGEKADKKAEAPSYTFKNNIQISRQGGKEWQPSNKAINKPTASDPDILSMAVNPNDGDTVYLGLRKGGLMRTTDGGENWEFLNLITDQIAAVAFDPEKPKTIYVSTVAGGRGKILTSDDGGEKWFELYTFPTDGLSVLALAVDRKNPKIIYATTSDRQAIKSIDKGASWKNIYQSGNPVSEIALDTERTNLVYFLEKSGGILRSLNGGESFESLSKQLSDSKLQTSGFEVLEVDPSRTGWVYLAGSSGIIRSKDSGNTWENIATLNDPRSAPVSALAINPTDSKEIIYGATLATYKSTDEGRTWSTSQFNLNKGISLLKYSSTAPTTIYAAFSGK